MKYGLLYDSELECRNSAGGIIDFGAIIIPFKDEEGNTIPYFIARYIGEKAERANVRYKNPPKSEAGGLPIWNPSSLYAGEVCFVVEGIFDALSILQVGGEAAALNGIGNTGKLIEALRERPTASKLVISFDRDGQEATERSARELTKQLRAMGFDAICNNDICGSFKDPNERLVSDPAGFRVAVQAKIESLRHPKIDASASP